MQDDHQSIAASLEDFEHSDRDQRSPLFDMPSCHSGFRSEYSESEPDQQVQWAPPAWRKTGSGWFKSAGSRHGTESGSHHSSPRYESADEGDLTIPANVPLPSSPEKGRSPRQSEDPYPEGQTDFAQTFGGMDEAPVTRAGEAAPLPENTNNYIRFALRAEVQHRTEPYEAALSWARAKFDNLFQSRTSAIMMIILGIVAFLLSVKLTSIPVFGPAPDLVKVAGLAKSFEPLIHYSEHGIQQISDLQDTGIAVWDLGESMRSSNMTSAPIIVDELDDLSKSFKDLAHELTKFFAHVDLDVDGILLVIDWAKRELATISAAPPGTLATAYDNFHDMLARTGMLENADGLPSTTEKLLTSVLGQPTRKRNLRVLQQTFSEFLSVLEESIAGELKHAQVLFGLFEAIDGKFHNLQRATSRESDKQEREEDELLSSLWSRLMGANAYQLKKFDRNKKLLASVRGRTLHNRRVLVDHNTKLLQLKSNLEILRQKLVSPLVRRNDSSALTIQEQIAGLDSTFHYLSDVREQQKRKHMEAIYAAGNRHVGVTFDRDATAIEGP
ncbi:hypothetical protein EV356DRAFT_439078 [Viridothelium virens]|uniref:Uncharacterized protein n=1 Tax=Viridothelium virens TaxID=1048519 RepID=A0A6A6HMC5_VIRVR|nr:hypothetical protein EV356DRAFT_439078 [Viridothelium virens]